MAISSEIRTNQKSMLFDILIARRDDHAEGIKSKNLDRLMRKMIAAMEQEDVVWVEKQVAETP